MLGEDILVGNHSYQEIEVTVGDGAMRVGSGHQVCSHYGWKSGVPKDVGVVGGLEPSTAYASGAYIDAKYVRFTDAPCPPELSGGTAATVGQTPSAPGTPGGTLVNALLAHCGDTLSGIGGERRPGIVHRIDKDTTGLLVVAKSDRAHHGLAAQFEDHSVNRRYLAVVHTLDKAGGYALQQHGDWLVESVAGSESNVIGLPVEALRQALGDLGISLSWSRDGGTGLGR